jgi:hypothetical protein
VRDGAARAVLNRFMKLDWHAAETRNLLATKS